MPTGTWKNDTHERRSSIARKWIREKKKKRLAEINKMLPQIVTAVLHDSLDMEPGEVAKKHNIGMDMLRGINKGSTTYTSA